MESFEPKPDTDLPKPAGEQKEDTEFSAEDVYGLPKIQIGDTIKLSNGDRIAVADRSVSANGMITYTLNTKNNKTYQLTGLKLKEFLTTMGFEDIEKKGGGKDSEDAEKTMDSPDAIGEETPAGDIPEPTSTESPEGTDSIPPGSFDPEPAEPESTAEEDTEGPAGEMSSEDHEREEAFELYSPEWTEKQFAEHNIDLKDLESLPFYTQLSDGQKALLVENFKQALLGRIEEEAAVQYKQNTAQAKFFGRIWRGMLKGYFTKQEKHLKYEELAKGGIEPHREVLQALSEGLYMNGPDIVVKDNELQVQYVRSEDFKRELNEDEIQELEDFNAIASEYARMPYEWSLASATRKQQQQYEQMKNHYDAAKEQVFAMQISEFGEKENALRFSKIDTALQMNQFLTQHPDVEKELQKIESPEGWKDAIKSAATERGLYIASGMLSRMASVGLMGWVGAPLAASGFGAFMARRRTKEGFRESDILARKGVENESEYAKGMVKARKIETIPEKDGTTSKKETGLVRKVDVLLDRINAEQDEKKLAILLQQLSKRLDYVKEKSEKGLIDFGKDGSERIYNQYSLVQALSRGHAIEQGLAESHPDPLAEDADIAKRLSERLEKYIGREERAEQAETDIERKRSRKIQLEMVKGAALAAGLSLAGRTVVAGVGKAWDISKELFTGGEQEAASDILHDAALGSAAEHAPLGHEAATTGVESEVASHDVIADAGSVPDPEAATDHVSGTGVEHGIEQGMSHEDYRLNLPETPPKNLDEILNRYGSDFDANKTYQDWRLNLPEKMPEGFTLDGTDSVDVPVGGQVAAAAHHAVEAAPIPEPEPVDVKVSVREGEGMIKALGRVLEQQHGLEHANAMKVANSVWAQDPEKWFNLVHKGDTFSVELKGLDSSTLAHTDPHAIAEHLNYDQSSFENTSGLQHAKDLPIHTSPEVTGAAVESPHGLADGFSAQDSKAYYDTMPDKVSISDDGHTFLSNNNIRYDVDKKTFWIDLDKDGVLETSDKTQGLQLSDSDKVQYVTMEHNPKTGNLIIHAYDKATAGAHDLGSYELRPSLDVEAPSPEVHDVYATAYEGSPEVIKTMQTQGDTFSAALEKLKGSHPDIHEKFEKVLAKDMTTSERRTWKMLMKTLEITKAEAKQLAKPIDYIFTKMYHGGVVFYDTATVSDVLENLPAVTPDASVSDIASRYEF